MKSKIFKLNLMFERLLLLSTSFPWSTSNLSYKNEIHVTYQTDNWRVRTHQEEPLHMCSWCGGARHARKFCMGVAGQQTVLWVYVNIPDGVIIRKHAWQV